MASPDHNQSGSMDIQNLLVRDSPTQAGGCMSATPYSTTRQPVMPSGGGLMGRNFTYRTAEKTDVRLTWQHARSAPLQPSLAKPPTLEDSLA